MILSDFVLLDETSGATSNPWYLPPEATQVTLQVSELSDKPNIIVGGVLDTDINDIMGLSVISLADFEILSTIEADGLYVVGVSGVKILYVGNQGTEGSVKVYGVCVG